MRYCSVSTIQLLWRTSIKGVVPASHTYITWPVRHWNWCEAKKIWVDAAYIPSRENKVADEQSRIRNIDIESELVEFAFKKIITRFDNPSIDLFASRANTKCKSYYSWERNPDAMTIDAFTISWRNLNFYAFPPFMVVKRILQKIVKDKASRVLVVPLWTAQLWYPLFHILVIGEPIIFKPSINLLSSSFRNQDHPLAKKLTLVAAGLLETLFKRKSCPKPLWRSY